ncbi:MAG TPA: hypothetical protein VLI92_04295 [Candidatus Saccharimonadales bacterium]|nr:hypothetical protein [Candidatus Saccharimonadales bacterium]
MNTWRVIDVGTFPSVRELTQALVEKNIRYTAGAAHQMDLIPLSPRGKIDLALVSVAQLGFNKVATYSEICTAAARENLTLCPAEVGPQLRLQYRSQLTGDMIFIAMELVVLNGRTHIFSLERDVDMVLWLALSPCYPSGHWHRDARFVFVNNQ